MYYQSIPLGEACRDISDIHKPHSFGLWNEQEQEQQQQNTAEVNKIFFSEKKPGHKEVRVKIKKRYQEKIIDYKTKRVPEYVINALRMSAEPRRENYRQKEKQCPACNMNNNSDRPFVHNLIPDKISKVNKPASRQQNIDRHAKNIDKHNEIHIMPGRKRKSVHEWFTAKNAW